MIMEATYARVILATTLGQSPHLAKPLHLRRGIDDMLVLYII